MRGVRELLAVVGALGVALSAVLLGAPSAVAGGPTSVLVVCPESAETAGLYHADEEYGELARLLGEPGAGARKSPPGLTVGSGRQINVTWLVHDVSPWRVDRVFPDVPGSKEAWIHTATDVPRSMNGYWHRAEQPARLRALLKKLGVMGASSGAGTGAIPPASLPLPTDEPSAAPAATPAGPPRGTVASGTDHGTDWWWAIPGAVGGAAATLLLRPLVPAGPGSLLRRRRQRATGPRQELRDS
ncbi:hypothetical protein [Streptomyces sp. NBC_01176]|uniref:hypothetical protein n=1 Tax=Streptomyces sp. NBC_01176 TaxID=2903760 RepID=UPI00386871E3|nr:hypothetical protein OG199_17755 [Streptomyces sp. NBC_01176]